MESVDGRESERETGWTAAAGWISSPRGPMAIGGDERQERGMTSRKWFCGRGDPENLDGGGQ